VTLSRRLGLGLALLVVTLLACGFGVTLTQHSFAMNQLDERVTQLSTNPRLLRLVEGGSSSAGAPVVPGDFYVGLRAPDGSLTTLVAPADDPTLLPDLGQRASLPRAAGIGTRSGNTDSVRAVTVPTGGARDATLVVAISTAPADASEHRLLITMGLSAIALALTLGLVGWWIQRLGLTPINRMTAAADQIAAGSRDREVPLGAPGTEAHRLGTALNAMLATVARAEDRMRRFVADASHELRTPLTTLRGYSSLHLEPTTDPAATADAMRRIHSEARRMGRLVDDLLDLHDLDEHGVAQRELVDVAPLLGAVVADLHVVAPDRAIALDTQPRTVHVDPDRLTQAVLALTSNALQHTPPTSAVTVRSRAVGGSVRIEVSDTGPGIDPTQLPQIFDRLHRVDAGRARTAGGSGLGLAIVASIATAHGGRYGVESQPGSGSTFWIEFPAMA
jgi:two-component system OmpR family sensor kinase